MKDLIIPHVLKQGDTIASITLSYGAAGRFPHRYAQGVRQIEAAFGVKVVPSPHALCSPEEIYNHPDWRLEDMMWAFKGIKRIWQTGFARCYPYGLWPHGASVDFAVWGCV